MPLHHTPTFNMLRFSNLSHIPSLVESVLLAYLFAIEILLPWQPEKCAITQLYQNILSLYLAHPCNNMITVLPNCYQNTVITAMR